jgi:hypothetical protein
LARSQAKCDAVAALPPFPIKKIVPPRRWQSSSASATAFIVSNGMSRATSAISCQ